jgi:hypothetical protein
MMDGWAQNLRNLYYRKRMLRPGMEAKRRAIYREIEKEKKRLVESGVDAELVRLCCRFHANLDNRNAGRRFEEYDRQIRLPFDGDV